MSSKFSPRLTIFALLTLTAFACCLCFWVCDDAYISFRYSRNLANGFGLRYNLDATPPVEGYSNTLWVLIAAIFEFFKLGPDLWMPLLSIFAALTLILRINSFLLRECELSPYIAIAALCSLAFFPPFLVWSTSGLATMPFSLFIFLFYEICISQKKNFSLFYIVLVVAGLLLIRAEGFAWILAILFLGSIFGPNRKLILKQILPTFLLILTAHFSWRYSYYHALLPNTAHAKVGFSLERLIRGNNYLIAYLLTFITPLASLLLLPFIRNLKSITVFLTTLAMFLGFFTYAVLVGGDYMSMGRFFIPGLPFQIILLGLILKGKSQRTAYLISAALVVIAALPMANMHLIPQKIRSEFHFRLNRSTYVNELEHWHFMIDNSARWKEKGLILQNLTQPSESIIEGAIGNVGYFSSLTIFDRMGLVTKIKRSKRPQELRSPGHDVRVPASYFYKYQPTYIDYKQIGPQGLKNLSRKQKDYPDHYAPVVHELKTNDRNRFIVLIKYFDKLDAANELWKNLELKAKGL